MLGSWDQLVAKSYDSEEVGKGFCCFTEFKKSVTSIGPDQSLENVYADFVEKYGQFETVSQFKNMFERIQIKTHSEAVCETIGSIMSIATSKGKNCDPVKFSQEHCVITYLLCTS